MIYFRKRINKGPTHSIHFHIGNIRSTVICNCWQTIVDQIQSKYWLIETENVEPNREIMDKKLTSWSQSRDRMATPFEIFNISQVNWWNYVILCILNVLSWDCTQSPVLRKGLCKNQHHFFSKIWRRDRISSQWAQLIRSCVL